MLPAARPLAEEFAPSLEKQEKHGVRTFRTRAPISRDEYRGGRMSIVLEEVRNES